MMCLDVLIFDLIPVEGNDTFQSEIEAHGGPRSASIRLDPPRVDFHWAGQSESFRFIPIFKPNVTPELVPQQISSQKYSEKTENL